MEEQINELKNIKAKFGEKIASQEVAKTIKEYFNEDGNEKSI